MAANLQKYYLCVDGKIVDFNEMPNFSNMESFLRLSIFTGIFKNRDYLIETLYALGLIDSLDVLDICIVKRIGNKRDGYDYEIVTYDVVYKDAAQLLSVGSIKEFLNNNRNNYSAILDFLESFHSSFSKLVSIFEVKIHYLSVSLDKENSDKKDKIREEIEKRKNSLRNFNSSLVNIEELYTIVRRLTTLNHVFNRQLELEYISRLDKIVEDESYYVRGNKKTVNYRGIVRLANTVVKLYATYPDLYRPYTTNIYLKDRLEFLRAIKETIESKKKQRKKNCDEDSDEMSVEPDTFMFLEKSDFENLLGDEPTQEEIKSIEDSILNLEERQRSFVLHERRDR